VAYDPVNKHLFVANRTMNRVDVFSTLDQSRVAQISIAGASSVDLAANGATVWIGTSLQEIVAVDAGTLHIKARYLLDGLRPPSGIIFNRPVEVLSFCGHDSSSRPASSCLAGAVGSIWVH
jgi:hypothetical protein